MPPGYFTSRPASKGFIRSSSSYLQAARQLQALSGLPAAPGISTDKLEWAVSITQVREARLVGWLFFCSFAFGSPPSPRPRTPFLRPYPFGSPHLLPPHHNHASSKQHHDAITGTAKQAVANDYHRLLSVGRDAAAKVVEGSLLRLLLADDEAAGQRASVSSKASGSAATAGEQSAAQWSAAVATAVAAAARRLLAWGSGGGSLRHHFLQEQLRSQHDQKVAEDGKEGPEQEQQQEEAKTTAAATGALSITLSQCPLLNASTCPATMQEQLPSGGFLVVVYNPLAVGRTGAVQLPVPDAPDGGSWVVQGESRG